MAQKSNLTIEVLSIIGGVLTAIFFLGFLALSSILRSETSCLIVGSILIITTLFVNRLLTKPFLDAMNITCYIAGCILAGYGMNRNMDVLFIVLIGISVVTMLLSKGFILTFLSVISFYMALFGEITNLFSSLNPLNVLPRARHPRPRRPLRRRHGHGGAGRRRHALPHARALRALRPAAAAGALVPPCADRRAAAPRDVARRG